MPRVHHGYAIDYRHIIDSLVRKPGAFAGYQYHESLFPRPVFRQVYDHYSVEISQPLLGEYDQLHGFKTSEAA